MERLREYNDLAAQYDATYKDTVEEAEKTGGFIEVRPASQIDTYCWVYKVYLRHILTPTISDVYVCVFMYVYE